MCLQGMLHNDELLSISAQLYPQGPDAGSLKVALSVGILTPQKWTKGTNRDTSRPTELVNLKQRPARPRAALSTALGRRGQGGGRLG